MINYLWVMISKLWILTIFSIAAGFFLMLFPVAWAHSIARKYLCSRARK